MTSKTEKDRQKQIQDKCQAILTQMLRDEDNKYCVDCDAKGPRWASWNLGIFLCIRCAGIHRNLGVHISKVKSVNLDTWTPEQVVSLQQMGNSRARAVYEANLPDNFRRPQTDSALEAFVRAKYEQKKYIAREWVPPPTPKNVERLILGFSSDERLIDRRMVNWDKELDEEAERQKKRKKEAKQQQTRKSTSSLTEVAIPQLLPKPKGSTSPKPGRPLAESNRTPPKQSTQDLLGLDTPTGAAPSSGGNGDDAFTSFLSAPPPANTATATSEVAAVATQPSAVSAQVGRVEGRSAEEESFFNQPGPGAQEKRQMTKASILALYGSAPTQQFPMPGAVFNQPAPTYAPAAVPMGFPPVAQTAAIPNGMMASQPMQSAVLQNGVFGNTQPAAANLASNPFFNMATPPMVQPTLGYAPVAQEHGNTTNASSAASDLMLDFSNVCSLAQSLAPAQLPQQMARLNLGAPMMGVPQTQMMGLPVQQPVPVAAAAMGIPAGNPMGVGSFVQAPNSGHTLATNLWQ